MRTSASRWLSAASLLATALVAFSCAASDAQGLHLLDEVRHALAKPAALRIEVTQTLRGEDVRLSYTGSMVVTRENELDAKILVHTESSKVSGDLGTLWAKSDGKRLYGHLALHGLSPLDSETPSDLRDRVLDEIVRFGCFTAGALLARPLRGGEVLLPVYEIRDVRESAGGLLDGSKTRVLQYTIASPGKDDGVEVTLKLDAATGFPLERQVTVGARLEREMSVGSSLPVERYAIRAISRPAASAFTFDRGAPDDVIATPTDEPRGEVRRLAFSPDGALLAAASDSGLLRVWNTANWEETMRFSLEDAAITALAFAGRPARIVTGPAWPWNRPRLEGEALRGDDSAVRLWDPATARQVGLLTGHEGDIRALAKARQRPLVASAGSDQTIRLWDSGRWMAARVVSTAPFEVLFVAISGDGTDLAWSGRDPASHKMRNEIVHLGEHPTRLEIPDGGPSADILLAFSEDGDEVYKADGSGVTAWATADGRFARTLTKELPVLSLDAAGGRIAVALRTEILVFRASELSRKRIPKGSGQLNSVALSPNGRQLAACSQNNIAIWQLSP